MEEVVFPKKSEPLKGVEIGIVAVVITLLLALAAADSIWPPPSHHSEVEVEGKVEWVVQCGNARECAAELRAACPNGGYETLSSKELRVRCLP